jgi:hypothetical protein
MSLVRLYTESMLHSAASVWGWNMEAQHYAARAKLRKLDQQHPGWTHAQMAAATGYSIGWVRKWRERLRAAAPDDAAVLWGRSRARKTTTSKCTPAVVERILEIRDHPPENLQRTPGPNRQIKIVRVRQIWVYGTRIGVADRPIPPQALRDEGR